MMIISVERSFSQLLTVLAVWLKEPQIVHIRQPVNIFRTIRILLPYMSIVKIFISVARV
jgi:hypothetical protein